MAEPYPTPTRLKLMRAIAAGQVWHYPWKTPVTYWGDSKVTASVNEFTSADPPLVSFAPRPEEPERRPWPVMPTDAGREWLHINTKGT